MSVFTYSVYIVIIHHLLIALKLQAGRMSNITMFYFETYSTSIYLIKRYHFEV